MNETNSAINDDTLGGRLKLLKPQELTAEQQGLYHHLVDTQLPWAKRSQFQAATEDGRLIGPFNAFLYNPYLGRAYTDYVQVASEHTSLSPRVQQIVILTVGAVWRAAYELYAHIAVARTVGLDEATIQAIKNGTAPATLAAEESLAYIFTHTLVTKYTIDDELYGRAVQAFGEEGVVDMIHLIGLYLTTCALLNAFNIPTPSQP